MSMRKIKHLKKKLANVQKNKMIIVSIICLFIFGLILAVGINNYLFKDRNQNLEVTFADPHTAVIFWTTQNNTISYVKYGESESNKDMQAYQTSSVAGTSHAVVINDIPKNGIFYSLHNESDPPLLLTKTLFLKFNPEEFIE